MLKSPLGSVRADTLHAAPITRMLFFGVLSLGIGLGGHYGRKPMAALSASAVPVVQQAVRVVEQSVPVQAVAQVNKAVVRAVVPPEAVTREVEVGAGQVFSDVLSGAGVDEVEAQSAMNAVAKVFPLIELKAGQDMTLSFERTPREETFKQAVFQPVPTREVAVWRQSDGTFTAEAKDIPVVRERIAVRGEIRSSVFEAGERAGVPHTVMAALTRIYAHSIDFQRDIRAGDSFEVLYDQPKTVQGKVVGAGSIIYASMRIGKEVRPVYRVTFADGTIDYFDGDGHSARRALLRTPVAVARITSRFGMRTHPLLGYSRMHKGVDFGAPIGTPIYAAGAGVVTYVGFKGGFGRYVRLRHPNGIETIYGHMSRFNKNIHVGSRLKQGDVIAYVGNSGRSTGPHLHFEVHVNGRAVNPLTVKRPVGRVLKGQQLAEFKRGKAHIRQEYAQLLDSSSAAEASGPIQVSSRAD
ncbi:MAG: M23 family metallopeptidase [Alphaproteobacteria bacterium]|nr:M23 family metallopeptidase [Alphaproteobacteria bacterium]